MKCSAEKMAEEIRRAEEGCAGMQASIASLHQCINVLRMSYRKRGETSVSFLVAFREEVAISSANGR